MNRDLKESHNFFHSLCIRPKVTFESQEVGEEVILLLRAHPSTQIGWILNAIGLTLIIFLANGFLVGLISATQLFVFNVFSFAFVLSYAWVNFLLWYFTVGIVTTKRLIDVDFVNVLYKEVTSASLEHVSEVTSTVGGYVGSLFQFGNVFVKTAGVIQNIEFERVPRPSEVVTIINDLIRDSR